MGPGDHHVPPGQASICTKKARRGDCIIIQEKLDGSNCGVALLNGNIIPLSRAGYPAISSPYIHHRMFHEWAIMNSAIFRSILMDGEALVGEWLALAHGTRYELTHGPFVAFDIMKDGVRLPFSRFVERVGAFLPTPAVISVGGPMSVAEAMTRLGDRGYHGALDPPEGVVYRVEHDGEVDFLAKYVRPDKVDGIYLPEISGKAIWNWKPPWWAQNGKKE